MINYPQIDPIAIQLGGIKIYWYGIAYLVSFALAWILARYRAKNFGYDWNNETITDFIFYCALGTIIGGRLGYVLFYGLIITYHDPWFPLKIWQGGMSFHGGLLGVIGAIYLFSRKQKQNFITVLDFAAPLAPIGLFLGRISNFINGEVFGRVTTLPWGMVFPNADALPRHPSQLYEALVEGVLLFMILWLYTRKSRVVGTPGGVFLFCYGIGRFVCEFFREPDSHMGFILFRQLTMGQLLSIPMVLLGLGILLHCNKKTNC